MCIIVAKNAGVKMPSETILATCFTNNPDGAGIMVGAKGKVYGFKGLMTYDAFTAKLKQLEKRFGPLDKLNVVMHFRIKTHGAAIAANTHPFPVASSYKALRKLEWVSDLGMAHNGIIDATGHHPDIKQENVSDTMVFIKRIVAPIARQANIMKDQKLQEALRLAAGSKLAFMDSEKLVVLGDFQYKEGVYYSNSTFETARYSYYGWSAIDWDDYDIPGYTKSKGKKGHEEWSKLSPDDEKYLMKELAFDYGLELLPLGFTIVCKEYEVTPTVNQYAMDDGFQLYYWDPDGYDWFESSYNDSLVDIRFSEEDADA